MDAAIPYTVSLSIAPTDIDFMGHVNNASYLTWVQQAVLSHWRRFAPADAVSSYLWVAIRHEITYRKPAFLHDVVFAETLLKRLHGARAFYRTLIRRGEDVLAEVSSSWCCVDALTRRPARLEPDVAGYFMGDRDETSTAARHTEPAS